jgi:hypothetical protein
MESIPELPVEEKAMETQSCPASDLEHLASSGEQGGGSPNGRHSYSSSPRSPHNNSVPIRFAPIRRPLTTHTPLGSPIHTARIRSNSLGSASSPIPPGCGGYGPTAPVMSPYTARTFMPVSPLTSNHSNLNNPALVHLPSLPPPEPSEIQKAMEAASAKERARAKSCEEEEVGMSSEELHAILKRERHRAARMAADLAALRASAVQSQFEAEVLEEGRINGLMRRLDVLQQEKGRIIVELEREEEMVSFSLVMNGLSRFMFSL